MARDILKTLKSEHDVLRGLFEQMEDTTDRAAKGRTELLARIESSLLPHARWEEIAFYPAFKARADRDGLKTHAEALLEHASIEETVLPNVKASDVATPEFAGRMKVLGELVEHHAKEEETALFSKVRELFSSAELAQLDEDYEIWKASSAAALSMAGSKLMSGAQGLVKRVADKLSP